MKFLGPLIVMTFLSISCSESKYNLTPVVTSCSLLLPVENYSQTIFFDMNDHNQPEFETCILQDSISRQSVLLLNKDIRENAPSLIMTNKNPNVIITTKYLTPKVVDSLVFMKSNWSLLYIIVTSESKFKCKNGTMTPNDFTLLENIMNNLWHRFQIMRVGVVFPLACKHKMVIYDGKRSSTGILYDRTIKLINATNYDKIHVTIKKTGEHLAHDYPMLAGLFYRYPTSITDCENLHYYVNLNLTHGFCGLDGMVMHDILSYFKFNVSFCHCELCNYFGFGSPGNITGTLGSVNRNEMDISFNSRFLKLYSNEQVYYLHYVTTDTLCALIKRPGVVPLWHGVFNLFSPLLWALIGVLVVAIGGIMWTTAKIDKTITGANIMSFWWYLHDSVTTTMLGYSPMTTKSLLMIRSACLLGSVFILAVYQGHISRIYTTVERFPTIRTLKDLYNSGAALFTSDTMKDIMRNVQNPEDKLQETFFNGAHLIPGDRLGIIMRHPCAATVDRKSDAEMSILEQYSDDHGNPLIDIVDECFYTYYLTYITRSGFPFFEDLLIFTQRLIEAGLPPKYYEWTQEMLEIASSMPDIDTEPRPVSKITLRDQCVAFGILFMGSILSVVVFVAEIWIGRRQRLKLFNVNASEEQ